MGLVARIPESSVSEGLKRLAAAHVLSSRKGERGFWFALEPPSGWNLRERKRANTPSSELVMELERWLSQCVGETPWLMPPPPTLAEALRETFAEGVSAPISEIEKGSQQRAGHTQSAVVDAQPRCPANLDAGEIAQRPHLRPERSFQRENFVRSEVLRQERSTQNAPAIDPRARVDRSIGTEIGSTKRSDRGEGSGERVVGRLPGHCENRLYVEGRLFDAIGWEEKLGRSARRFRECLDLAHEDLDQAISVGIELQKTGQLRKSLAAYLNGCAGRILDEIKSRRSTSSKI
jgi:hypothetical protein